MGAKVAAYTCEQVLNLLLDRPMRRLADLISLTGDIFVLAYYLIVAALVAFVPIVMSEETAGVPLTQLSEERAKPAGATPRQ